MRKEFLQNLTLTGDIVDRTGGLSATYLTSFCEIDVETSWGDELEKERKPAKGC